MVFKVVSYHKSDNIPDGSLSVKIKEECKQLTERKIMLPNLYVWDLSYKVIYLQEHKSPLGLRKLHYLHGNYYLYVSNACFLRLLFSSIVDR